MNWKYETESFEWNPDNHRFEQSRFGLAQFLDGVLAEMGSEGWELVDFAVIGNNGVAIFKQPA